ncbi:MAG TPA: molecular chaperone TorD family protein [bacterium]|nr:molecular chaperone TorD family protein [bacterium]
MSELVRALAVLAEPPGSEQARLGRLLGLDGIPDPAEYTEVFALQLYPYASVYLGAEGMLGGDARDRVAGFWRALHRAPPAEPDHLTALLGLYAALGEHARGEPDPPRRLMGRLSREAFLWEHLASWLFPYLDKLRDVAPPFYRSWGALLAETLTAEIEGAGPPGALPLHLRLAPPLPDPRVDGAEAFTSGLLSPVRSGMVLTRADLARAAHSLELGLRMGERRFILAALLSQDPGGTLGWLAGEALAWVSRHEAHQTVTGHVALFWAGRAAATAALLDAVRPGGAPP